MFPSSPATFLFFLFLKETCHYTCCHARKAFMSFLLTLWLHPFNTLPDQTYFCLPRFLFFFLPPAFLPLYNVFSADFLSNNMYIIAARCIEGSRCPSHSTTPNKHGASSSTWSLELLFRPKKVEYRLLAVRAAKSTEDVWSDYRACSELRRRCDSRRRNCRCGYPVPTTPAACANSSFQHLGGRCS